MSDDAAPQLHYVIEKLEILMDTDPPRYFLDRYVQGVLILRRELTKEEADIERAPPSEG